MASKQIFKSAKIFVPPADALNASGHLAYAMTAKLELTQAATTGFFANTAYTTAEQQLERTVELTNQVDANYIAKLALYSRQAGKMKDMPALLVAILLKRSAVLFKLVFPRVINNGRMVRNFVQIVRSGALGYKSLGSTGKKAVQAWLASRDDDQLFNASVGNDPSLADVIKLAHPAPSGPTRQALYAYLIGKELTPEQKEVLPKLVQEFETFKAKRSGDLGFVNGDVEVPDVPFQMLTALPLTTEDWEQIADNGNWQFLRMNLNTFARHGVFANPKVTKKIAEHLSDANAVRRAQAFPYQLLIAFQNVGAEVPTTIKNALQDAMEVATENVKPFNAPNGVLVFPDVSGSMSSAVTGSRGTATTAARCIDVAALISSTVLRRNPNSEVVPFDTSVHRSNLNSRDSIMTNAEKLRKFGGGGTHCALPLADANARKAKADLVIYVSDNESNVDARATSLRAGTGTMAEWRKFKVRNPNAKLVCIDLSPNGTTQASNDKDILNLGGFSDDIFETINSFVAEAKPDAWVKAVEATEL